MTSRLFYGEILDKELLEVTFFNVNTGEEFKGSWTIIGQYLLQRHFYVAGVWLLMVAMTLCLGGFLGYHVWLTSVGMTTNESAKWAQVKKWHKQEVRRYKDAVKRGLVVPSKSSTSGPVVPDGDVGCTGAVGGTPTAEEGNESDEPDRIYDPGPYPKNIYNQGLIENWKDVFFPRSLRQEALERWKTSLNQSAVPIDYEPEKDDGKSKDN
jgi:hypothetical protein